MTPALGLQLWSVRNHLQENYLATLEEIAKIGYKYLELIVNVTDKGLVFGKDLNAVQLKHFLDQTGLRAVGSHIVPMPGMDWERVVADYKTLGVSYLGCAIAFFNNRQEVLDFCKTFNQDAEFLKKNGIQYYYHNHFHEFQIFEGQSIYDTLLENLNKDLVKFEFDSYWATRGGQDPVAWLRKLGARCDLLHQKDLPADSLPVNWFEHFGPDHKMGMAELIETTSGEQIQFTEVGKGILDIPAIVAAGREYGNARYIFIEQDRSARGELESIAISYANLTKILSA